MRVLELEIDNVRGIRHSLLRPNGNNFVVWGPNGSGKSAVVDAIDFLLTGRVSRLTGKGTGGITMSKHGPHIDHMPGEARVRAIVQLSDYGEPLEIKRCMAHPDVLECDEVLLPHLKPVMALARQGQHVLTRREILKYITAEASTRAQEILDLLNIMEVESIRKSLVKVKNDFDKELQAAIRAVSKAKGAINSTLQQKSFSKDVVLLAVNENRKILNGKPILILNSTLLKDNLLPPTTVAAGKAINVVLLERDIQNLSSVTQDQNQQKIAGSDTELRSLIQTIISKPELSRDLARLELTKLAQVRQLVKLNKVFTRKNFKSLHYKFRFGVNRAGGFSLSF